MLIRAPWETVASDVTELRRFSARERHVAFWAALWTAAVVAELLVLRPALFDRDEPVQGLEVVFACVGGSFAACGLVAWHRRPDSRSGALMTATGFAFFLPTLLGELGTPLGDTLAVLLVDLWSVLFVALLVTLLTAGRLETTVDKLLVFSFVLPLLILGFVWMLFEEDIENNLLLAFPDDGIAHALDTAQRAILIGACVATVIVLGARWHAASRPRRRALLPTLAGSFVLLDLHGAADQRPRDRRALAAAAVDRLVLARDRPARVPRRPAALAAGARRALRPLPRPALDPRGRAAGDARPGARRPRASSSPRARPPVHDGDRSVAPVERDGRQFATLVYDSSLDDDPELVEAVAAAAAIALENSQLHAESEVRLAELQASRERIVAAGDAERRRLERNLHDGAQQRLVALAMQLRMIQADIRRDPAAAEALRHERERRARPVARGAARARARDPPGGARLRPRPRARVAGRARAGADRRDLRRRHASRSRSSSPPTSSPARRSPTSPSTPSATAASVRRLADRRAASRSRSPTTAPAARSPAPAPGCTACRTGSRRSAATSSSRARRARARS